ncbi:MAG: hypothetical protein RLZZ46_1038, partial [Bacteroidota bacterium]
MTLSPKNLLKANRKMSLWFSILLLICNKPTFA